MLEFAKALPHVGQLIADLIAKNMDWDGAEEMAARLAKAVPPNLLTPDQKDVPPQMQAYIQNLEAQLKQVGEQLKAAIAQLNDKGADREIAMEKIAKDFEAKVLTILQKAEEGEANRTIEVVKMTLAEQRAEKEALNPEPDGKSSGRQKE